MAEFDQAGSIDTLSRWVKPVVFDALLALARVSLTYFALLYFAGKIQTLAFDCVVVVSYGACVALPNPRLTTVFAQAYLAYDVFTEISIRVEGVTFYARVTLARTLDRALVAVLDKTCGIDARVCGSFKPVIFHTGLALRRMGFASFALSHLTSAVDALLLIFIVEKAFCTLITSSNSPDGTIITVAQLTALVFTGVEVDVELEALSAGITPGWSTDRAVSAILEQACAIDALILFFV